MKLENTQTKTNEKKLIEKRVKTVARYIINHNATIEDASKEYWLPKSIVASDLNTRLIRIDPVLYEKYKECVRQRRIVRIADASRAWQAERKTLSHEQLTRRRFGVLSSEKII